MYSAELVLLIPVMFLKFLLPFRLAENSPETGTSSALRSSCKSSAPVHEFILLISIAPL